MKKAISIVLTATLCAACLLFGGCENLDSLRSAEQIIADLTAQNFVSGTIPAEITELSQNWFGTALSVKEVKITGKQTPADSTTALTCDITTSNENVSFKSSYVLTYDTSLEDWKLTAVTENADARYTTVLLAEKRSTVDEAAYKDNLWIDAVFVSARVGEIGPSAFEGCTNLKAVTFEEGSNLTVFFPKVFKDCTSLSDINIPPNSVQFLSESFMNCSSIKGELVLGDYFSITDSRAFYGCTGITSLKVTSKARNAILAETFAGCTSLSKIALSADTVMIDASAFDGCTSIKSVSVESGNSVYKTDKNQLVEISTGTVIINFS